MKRTILQLPEILKLSPYQRTDILLWHDSAQAYPPPASPMPCLAFKLAFPSNDRVPYTLGTKRWPHELHEKVFSHALSAARSTFVDSSYSRCSSGVGDMSTLQAATIARMISTSASPIDAKKPKPDVIAQTLMPLAAKMPPIETMGRRVIPAVLSAGMGGGAAERDDCVC